MEGAKRMDRSLAAGTPKLCRDPRNHSEGNRKEVWIPVGGILWKRRRGNQALLFSPNLPVVTTAAPLCERAEEAQEVLRTFEE